MSLCPSDRDLVNINEVSKEIAAETTSETREMAQKSK